MNQGGHRSVTGFSGNEIFCLDKIGFTAGELCLGNGVVALGLVKGIGSGLANLAGGEVEHITNLVRDGRAHAYDRMVEEARAYGGSGLAGVSFTLVNHGGNIEFVAFGSAVHRNEGVAEQPPFSASADGQELYCLVDAGFQPRRFVFGNVAYSIGVGGNITGAFRGLARGEVAQYTQIFEQTRMLAVTRIKDEAKAAGANAVLGIKTSIISLLGAQEMTMLGTAASHPLLAGREADPVTSDLTNKELWNLVNMGYMPVQLVMGVSVYSLGLTSGISSTLKSLVGGKIDSLSDLLYEAREKALARVQQDAERCGADKVVGVTTRVYELGGGLVEFLVIGTAVKKMSGVSTRSAMLLPQAIIADQATFVESNVGAGSNLTSSQAASSTGTQRAPIKAIGAAIVAVLYVVLILVKLFAVHHSN